MEKQQVKTLILDLVKDLKWVTYTQLFRYLSAKGANPSGNFEIRSNYNKEKGIELVLWGGFSEVVVSAIMELLQEKELVALPFSLEAYFLSDPVFMEKLPYPIIKNLDEAKEGANFFATCLVDSRVVLKEQ